MKEKLMAGEVVFGAQLRFGSPAIAELFRHAGFDYVVFDFEHGFLVTFPAHRRLYEPLGFQEAKGTETCLQPAENVVKSCLHGRRAWLPDGMRPRIDAIAGRFRRRKTTCLCPSFPECMPQGYGEEAFADVDVVCPLRVQDIATSAPSS